MAAHQLQKSLAYLAEKGDLHAFTIALKKNPKAKDDKNQDSGNTPLIAAVKFKHYEIAKLLLDWGADVNIVDRSSDSALHIACSAGDDKMVKLLLDYGADINYVNMASHNTPLFEAILHNHTGACLLLLDQPYIDLTHRSDLGRNTALILAAENGLIDVVERLIEKGAELNAVNHWRSTALISCLGKQHFEIAKMLARAGADLYHKDNKDMTCLDLLKHNPDQLLILTDCGEAGRMQCESIDRIQQDEDGLKSIASLGELQKMNVALYINREWGISNLDQALRIVNVASRPPPPRDMTEQATSRKRINSASHGTPTESTPKTRDGRAMSMNAAMGGVSPVPTSEATSKARKSVILNTPVRTPDSQNGTPPPVQGRSTINMAQALAIRVKEHDLSIKFDTRGERLPNHWFNHFFVKALQADTNICSIDITGNEISHDMCLEMIEILKSKSKVQVVRTGRHGLDFDISGNPPRWFIDHKYLAMCTTEILSKVLQAWPMLFVAIDSAGEPSIFSGGNASSRISPIILHVFEDIASQSDFHPSHLPLPVDCNSPSAKATVPGESIVGSILDIFHHAFWFHLISLDQFANLAKVMSTEYPHLVHQYDHLHRDVASQASPECKKKITSATLIYDRYSITDYTPKHFGLTSQVFLAVDELSEEVPKPQVALKFVKAKWQFDRELGSRAMYPLDYEVILDLYKVNGQRESYQAASMHLGFERLKKFKSNLKRLHAHQRTLPKDSPVPGRLESIDSTTDSYPYCLVFPQAHADLANVVTHELSKFNGVNWEYIQQIAKQVVYALKNMHSLKIIHGDIRPLNIMRVGHRFVVIDLDSSLHFTQYITSSVTTAYMPPELVFLYTEAPPETGAAGAAPVLIRSSTFTRSASEGKRLRARVKVATELEKSAGTSSKLPFNHELASPAYDMWSLGALLYYLCLGEPLWQHSILHGEISEETMIKLGLWKPEYKAKKLSRITNPVARNLVAQLLSKEPKMRPTASRVLSHPFLSGKKVTRMVGEAPEYDVFISYRVKSDRDIALKLYDDLSRRGLKCFVDKRCLKKGVSWEEGFCDGLAQSLTFLALLSRGAINNPDNSRSDFSKLRADSPVDNVFLEHRLALELGDAGLVERILPVQIGDLLPDGRYSNFSASRCAPVLGNVVVHSVEEKLKEHMDRLGLGTPLKEEVTVKQVYDNLMLHQGVYVEGNLDESLASLVDMITHMVDEAKAKANLKYMSMATYTEPEPDPSSETMVDLDPELELTLACPTSSDEFSPSDYSPMMSASAHSVLSKHFGGDGAVMVAPSPGAGGQGVRAALAARDAKINALEDENRNLRAQLEALRLQLDMQK